jgi:predicted amidohydrolase YtcJ
VSSHLPKPTRADRAAALRAAINEAQRNGITSVQNTEGSAEELEIYADARREGDLDVRVYSALSTSGVPTESAIGELSAVAKGYPDDPLFKAGAIKIELDGVVETQTAAMLAPYANSPDSGTPAMDADAFNKLVRLLDAGGWQVMTHAVGDRAVNMALTAYEHAVRSNPLPDRGRRHRIEHADTVDAYDLPRFGALGVIASMQPFTGDPTPARIELWSKNVGAERSSRAWPYHSISAGAGRLAFGSDWPSAPLNPMVGLHTAVTRTDPDGLPEGGWYPGERIALKGAIDAYTSGAAWASFDEQRKGTLAAGMLADIVVLSEDIFEAPASRLASTRVTMTIFDGRIVYRRDGAQTD